MKNKIIIIIAAILIVSTIGGWIYFLTKGDKEPIPTILPVITPSPTIKPVETEESITKDGFTKLSNNFVLSPIVSSENTVLFFDKQEGIFKNVVNILGVNQETKLSETVFINIFKIDWSNNLDKALIAFEDNDKIRYSLFDLTQNLTYLLPNYITAIDFSFDDKNFVIYHQDENDNNYLATLNLDGTKETKLLEINFSNIEIFWLDKDNIIFYQKPAPLMPVKGVFIYNLKTKNLTTLSINLYDSMNLYGLEAVPSKNGNYLLLSATDSQNKNPELYVFDIANNKLLEMPFKSFVDKCVFTNDNKNIYCAYSNSFSNNNFSYPFDYYLGLISSQDSFAKVNLETGEFTIFIENTPYDAYNLQISEDESFLIFINKYDGLLYKLDLTNQEV